MSANGGMRIRIWGCRGSLPTPGASTYESRGIEMAVADFPLFGMRTRMIVSVLVDSSSPARRVASSSDERGLPCASVRLSSPTSRMSMAPSSPPPPRAADEMWLIPDSNERILLQATPVPTTTAAASKTARVRNRRDGISPGYLREGRRAGSASRRARLGGWAIGS